MTNIAEMVPVHTGTEHPASARLDAKDSLAKALEQHSVPSVLALVVVLEMVAGIVPHPIADSVTERQVKLSGGIDSRVKTLQVHMEDSWARPAVRN